MLYGSYMHSMPSQFLKEIPEDILHREKKECGRKKRIFYDSYTIHRLSCAYFGQIVGTARPALYIAARMCYNLHEHYRWEEIPVKKTAIIAALLALLMLLTLGGCKNETMLDNFTSDTYELGEEDPLSWEDIF